MGRNLSEEHRERLFDPERLAVLDRTGLMGSAAEESFDRLTRLAARLIDAPTALMSVVGREQQFFKSSTTTEPRLEGVGALPVEQSFCQYVVSSDAPLRVEDAREHPDLHDNPLVEERGVIAYAGVPLKLRTGHVLGTLCVIDAQPRDWEEGTLETLRDLAAIAVTQVELGELTRSQRDTVAELQRSQERFRTIFREAPMGITLVSMEEESLGCYEDANAAFTRMVGYTASELREQTFLDITHPDHRESDRAAFEEMRRGEREVLREEKRYVRKDGSSVWMRIAMRVLHSVEGRADSAVSVVEDITHRREVDRMKDEFISVVSHELRTPLTSIRGSLGLLAGGLLGPLPERGQRMLELATSNTDRLVRLINDMLDIERIESGRVEIRVVDVVPAVVMNAALEAMGGMADEHGVELEIEPVEAAVRADSDRLEQVFTNLLSNAIKFSPPGSRVVFDGRPVGGCVRFSVRDEGRGIPPDQLESIFERFQQVDATDSREKGGTGLGLAICRSILEQMGGRIWAESEPGSGASFFFELPAAEQERPMGVLPGRPRRDRVAVVASSDEALSVASIERTLASLGIRMTRARSRRELKAAAAANPLVILLDMEAEVGGWEAVVELKSDRATRDIPLIMMGPLGASRHHESRPLEWLTKPLDEEALSQRITRLLSDGRNANVLIVEDDPDLAQILATVFETRGIQATVAGRAADAIGRCEKEAPDLLVLDLMLPDGHGGQVVEWLRRNNRLGEVPVVVYSAREVDDLEAASLGVSREDLLNKGRTAPDELAERVSRILERVVTEEVE